MAWLGNALDQATLMLRIRDRDDPTRQGDIVAETLCLNLPGRRQSSEPGDDDEDRKATEEFKF